MRLSVFVTAFSVALIIPLEVATEGKIDAENPDAFTSNSLEDPTRDATAGEAAEVVAIDQVKNGNVTQVGEKDDADGEEDDEGSEDKDGSDGGVQVRYN